jgi:hypothetical protein
MTQYVANARSKDECTVTFDDIELVFRVIGSSLTLAAKMRHGGRQLRYIPDHLYNGAKDAAKQALEARKREALPQGQLFV